MKKILMSLLTIGLVASVAFGATQALFSDTETSQDNTFSTGTLDLTVDGQDDPNVVHVTLANMKPGDTAQYQWVLANAGSLTGKPWIEITNVKNYDNGCNEPELGVPDSTCNDPGLGEGELGQFLMMQLNAPGSVGYVYPHGALVSMGGDNARLTIGLVSLVLTKLSMVKYGTLSHRHLALRLWFWNLKSQCRLATSSKVTV